jgi:hypothetical protein
MWEIIPKDYPYYTKSLTVKGELNHMYEKIYSKETKGYVRSLNIWKTFSPETKKLLSNINSVPKHKVLQKEVFKRSKKQ